MGSYGPPQGHQRQYGESGMPGYQPPPSDFSWQQSQSPFPPQQPVSSHPAFGATMPQGAYSQPQLPMRQPLASSPMAGSYGAYGQLSASQSQQRLSTMTPPAYTTDGMSMADIGAPRKKS